MNDSTWDDKIDDPLTAFTVMVAVRAAESGMLDGFLEQPVQTCEEIAAGTGIEVAESG